ncbi:MAG: DNA polymerase III subunit [Candidatus Pacebacteria bacterium]|nr:DNA polymerase III subunit [Candidatus Paceibacterota bacterium]
MIIGHKKQWGFLKEAAKKSSLPQAFIFAGEENLGKKKMAFEFIKLLFCEGPDAAERPCQKCLACLLIEKATHPDFIFIEPQGKEIHIDQIRENLQKRVFLKPVLAPQKAVIINDAHCLNVLAQNCFLKTLEEPQTRAIFILVSSLPELLLSTIRSRCEIMKFYPLKADEMEQVGGIGHLSGWEELNSFSQGKPGIALRFAKEPQLAADLKLFNQEAKGFLQKDLADKLIFIKHLFERNKDNAPKECFGLLENMVWVLRAALWQRINSQNAQANEKAFLRLKKAIELTEEAKMLLQTTNVNSRLLLENLVLNF